MRLFSYQGYVRRSENRGEGHVRWKATSGTLQADSLSSARHKLHRIGVYVCVLDAVQEPRWRKLLSNAVLFQHTPSANDLSEFCRQAAVLLRLQVPLDRVLHLCAEKQKDCMKRILVKAIEAVEHGYSLGQAFQQQPQMPPLVWQCLRAAELGDSLPEILERLSMFYGDEHKRKGKIRSALFYPQMVLCIAILVAAFILVYLLPSYVDTFEQARLDMPGPTRALLSIWDALSNHSVLLVLVILACAMVIRSLYLRFRESSVVEQVLLRVPVVGDFRKAHILTLLCRTLAMLLHVGIPLDRALLSSESIAFSKYWQNILKDVRYEVSAGRSLAAAMDAKQCFPTQLLQLLYIGEEAGGIADLLSGAGAFYDDQVSLTSERLVQIIQPLAMLLIALVIGGLAVAMMLPLYAQLDFSNYLSGIG